VLAKGRGGREGDGEGEYEELEGNGAKQSTVEPDEKEVEWGSDTRFLNSEHWDTLLVASYNTQGNGGRIIPPANRGGII